jgi:hypothetical protein
MTDDDVDKTPLQIACSRLYDYLGCGVHPHYVACIGIAEIGKYNDTATIHVALVRKPRGTERSIPKEWDGFPVVVKVTGQMRLSGGSPE